MDVSNAPDNAIYGSIENSIHDSVNKLLHTYMANMNRQIDS